FRDADSLCELAPSEDDETVIIFYTGGTTGRAKGVMLSNINFQCNTDCSIALYRMQEHWKFIVLGPLFHLAAGSRVFSSTALGGHCVILPKFDVLEVFQAIQQYRINSATLVPTMFQMMLDHPEFSNYDLSSLKMLAYGAAPMSVALLRRVIKAFPGVEIFQTFGMTEASPIVTSLDSKYHVLEGPNANKLGSVGRAVSHVEVKIVGEDGNAQNAGETGEIFARGDNIMTGYWRLPRETAAALEGGWYHTGDIGSIDKAGVIRLLGRIKTEINRAGMKILPEEIDALLEGHEEVVEACAFGVPDAISGETVAIAYTLKEGSQLSPADLRTWCQIRIRLDCVPEKWYPVSEIPKTDRGKVNRGVVREYCLEGKNR
ncbi:MAG: long-chain fatty acid--CoA ligase, partial [Proteobacteria bacterium]|nr:long-chain fatty acid--CoA ligase [Pseudomonadota bacterium]